MDSTFRAFYVNWRDNRTLGSRVKTAFCPHVPKFRIINYLFSCCNTSEECSCLLFIPLKKQEIFNSMRGWADLGFLLLQ